MPSESDDAQNNSCHRCRDEQQEAQLDNALRRKVDSPLHDSHDGSKSRVAGMKMSGVRDRAQHMLAKQKSAQDHHGGGKRNADAKNYRKRIRRDLDRLAYSSNPSRDTAVDHLATEQEDDYGK